MKKTKTKLLFVIIIFLFFLFPAFTQTAADIETMLYEKAVTFEQAAWLILASAMDEPPVNSQAAFVLAVEQGWISVNVSGGAPINFGNLSFLAMKAFDIKGGLMYRLFENRRYAFREMKNFGYITGRAYSGLNVSGEQFLQILGNIMTSLGGEW